MGGLPIEIGLRLMFGTPAPGFELQHGDDPVWPVHQAVNRAAHDPTANRERERDLVIHGARLIERAKLMVGREGTVCRRRPADQPVAIGDRNRLFDADQRRKPRREPVIAHRAGETFTLQQSMHERSNETIGIGAIPGGVFVLVTCDR